MKANGLVAATFAWMGLIYFLSSRPGSDYSTAQSWVDSVPGAEYFVHGGLFFVLGVLVFGVLRANVPQRGWLIGVDTVIFCTLYGISDEFHQTLVEGREATGFDLIADVLGGIVAATLLLLIVRFRKKPAETED